MKEQSKKTGFTIIELLTVMSIIVILISLLLPSLAMVRRFAKEVKQRAQFRSIGAALEMFHKDWGDYPPSAGSQDPIDQPWLDENSNFYCGAMMLCEAMVGQDLLGFHPESHFNSNSGLPVHPHWTNGLYPDVLDYTDDLDLENMDVRRGPYLDAETSEAYKLEDLYPNVDPPFTITASDSSDRVLCDMYSRVTHRATGRKVGMPILYYKPNPSGIRHDPNDYTTDPELNIYNYLDNDPLVVLGIPTNQALEHPLHQASVGSQGQKFYEVTLNEEIDTMDRPYNSESYILISAGYDSLYGTEDDIYNFEK